MPTLQEIIEQLLASPDQLALYYLDKFMMQGFPSPDIDKQVALAYAYAESIIRYKKDKQKEQHDVSESNRTFSNEVILCPKCAGSVNLTYINTLGGTEFIYLCSACGFQTTDPETLIIAPRSNGTESNANEKEG